MARIEKIFASGTIANVIFYERNGKPCARSKPARVQQTTATRQAARRFGIAKTLSRLIRQSLAGLLPHDRHKALMHRVDAGVLPWMQTVQPAGQGEVALPGFSCTGDQGYSEWCQQHVTAVLSGTTLQVTVAAIEKMNTPAGSNRAELTLVVSCIDPHKDGILYSEQQTVEMDLPPAAGSATVLRFDVVIAPGVFILLSAGLRYGQPQPGGQVLVEKTDLQPVAVVQGWYCGG